MMDRVYFLAIQGACWGRGENERQAKANMRKAGGKGKSSAYMVTQPDDKPAPYVDSLGFVCHFGKGLDWVSGKDVLGCKHVEPVTRQARDPWGDLRRTVVQMPDVPQCDCRVCRSARGEYVEDMEDDFDDEQGDDDSYDDDL
jgi:hypothetical protein